MSKAREFWLFARKLNPSITLKQATVLLRKLSSNKRRGVPQ